MSDAKNIQFYNILFRLFSFSSQYFRSKLIISLFRRIMGTLNMEEMNQNFYQTANGHMVPQHKLTDLMKADFKVMNDVAQFTRVTPTQRQADRR